MQFFVWRKCVKKGKKWDIFSMVSESEVKGGRHVSGFLMLLCNIQRVTHPPPPPLTNPPQPPTPPHQPLPPKPKPDTKG
jgi:hypothetical protein